MKLQLPSIGNLLQVPHNASERIVGHGGHQRGGSSVNLGMFIANKSKSYSRIIPTIELN